MLILLRALFSFFFVSRTVPERDPESVRQYPARLETVIILLAGRPNSFGMPPRLCNGGNHEAILHAVDGGRSGCQRHSINLEFFTSVAVATQGSGRTVEILPQRLASLPAVSCNAGRGHLEVLGGATLGVTATHGIQSLETSSQVLIWP